MLPKVPVQPIRLEEYREPAGSETVDRLRAAAEPFAGARILHVNSTAYGGGVAELLFTHVGLMQDMGIDVTWQVLEGSDDFFAVTKFVHNGLQSAEVPWTEHMAAIYLERVRANASQIEDDYDYVFIHDPQPAAILKFKEEDGARRGKWVWRCHIDTTTAYGPSWSLLRPYVEEHDAAIFTMPQFVRPDLTIGRVLIQAPSIDPLSVKNLPMPPDEARRIVASFKLDPERPLLIQISRFDPWKDPLGVIDAYRLVKKVIPSVQLAMIGSLADDDPEGQEYFDRTRKHAGGDKDVFLFTNLDGVKDREVNAFQRASEIVIQKSLSEGFGLVVAEALWKGIPVVAGKERV